MKRITIPAIGAITILSTVLPAAQRPVKVFLLVGQSNMEGKGQSGHIDYILNDPNTPEKDKTLFRRLVKDGKHVARDDVWIWHLGKIGNLTVGFGKATEKNGKPFGPELGLGHVLGDYYDEQVLLIKCAWGGKSLRRAFRPPSYPPSKAELEAAIEKTRRKDPGTTKESIRGSFGEYYQKTIANTREVLANLKSLFPGYKDQGYELVGMFWFQGWNDLIQGGNPEYGEQLASLIRDIRKDLKAPNLLVVIGESGQGAPITEDKKGSGMDIVRQGQAAPAKMPEFKGTVAFAQTHQFYDPSLKEYVELYNRCAGEMRKAKRKLAQRHDGGKGAKKAKKTDIPREVRDKIWMPWEAAKQQWLNVGSDQSYHFYGSGKIFYQMGNLFGKEMVQLLKK